jgi:hypothetical protein
MLRGYRGVIVAAFGWLTLVGAGQPPESAQKPENAIAANKIDQAAETVASAIREAAIPPEKDGGCNQGQDQRESDLCAQWKAADAARDAAQYGFWTLLISAAGTVLLIWTLWETRANARRELRAYVSVKAVSTGIHVILGKSITFSQKAIAVNGGSTPAYDFVSFGNIIVAQTEIAARHLAKPLPIDKTALSGGFVIHAGDEAPITFDRPVTIPIKAIDAVLNGEASLFLYGTISYVDTFKIRRRTDYCQLLESDPFRESWLKSMADPNTEIEVMWKTARFHNTAT